MISPLRFSAISLKDIKKNAVIQYIGGDQSYRILEKIKSTKKAGDKVTLLLQVEPTYFPPLAMQYTTKMEVNFEKGINNQFNLVG